MSTDPAIDPADQVTVTYFPVDNAAAEPDLNSWLEFEFDGVAWTEDWFDEQVRRSTHRVGVDEPQHIIKKERTDVAWGTQASFVQYTVLVATELYEWVATRGVEQLGRAVAERRLPHHAAPPTLEDALDAATQRVALKHDIDTQGLVVLGVTPGDDVVMITLREPESMVTYEVTLTSYGPWTGSIRCTRR